MMRVSETKVHDAGRSPLQRYTEMARWRGQKARGDGKPQRWRGRKRSRSRDKKLERKRRVSMGGSGIHAYKASGLRMGGNTKTRAREERKKGT